MPCSASQDKLAGGQRSCSSTLGARLGRQLAVMGDDWPDLPLFGRAAFACRAAQRACRAARCRAPRHRGARWRGCGARVLRPAADGFSGRYAALLQGPSDHARRRDKRTLAIDLDSLLQPLDPLPASGPQSTRRRGSKQPLWSYMFGQFALRLPAADPDGPAGLGHLVAGAATRRARSTSRARPQPPRHEPDYIMEALHACSASRKRRCAAGARCRAPQMRHYPDTNTHGNRRAVTIRAYRCRRQRHHWPARRARRQQRRRHRSCSLSGRRPGPARGDRERGGEVEFEGEFLHAVHSTPSSVQVAPARCACSQGTSELTRGLRSSTTNLTRTCQVSAGRCAGKLSDPPRR